MLKTSAASDIAAIVNAVQNFMKTSWLQDLKMWASPAAWDFKECCLIMILLDCTAFSHSSRYAACQLHGSVFVQVLSQGPSSNSSHSRPFNHCTVLTLGLLYQPWMPE